MGLNICVILMIIDAIYLNQAYKKWKTMHWRCGWLLARRAREWLKIVWKREKASPRFYDDNVEHLFQPILISFHIIFCVQLLKSGEVEVVERGEVGISLTGVRLTLDIIIKDMAGNVFFWHLYSDYCEFFAQNSRLYSHVRPSVCMHVVTDVTSLR